MNNSKYILNGTLFSIGMLFLLSGGLYYILARPSSALYLNHYLGFNYDAQITFNNIKYLTSYPSFMHVFSLSIITISFIEIKNINIIKVCFSWVLINITFEIYQLYNYEITNYTGEGIINAFFMNGSFDKYDIIFCFLGGIFAFLFVKLFFMSGRNL